MGGHGDGGVLVGEMSGESGGRRVWVDCCCCGHGGCVVYEMSIKAMPLS